MKFYAYLLFLTAVLYLNIKPAYSQEAAAYLVYDDYNLYHTAKDSTALVFVNMAYVRDEPSSKSNLIDSIPLGTSVKFIDEQGLNPTSLRGMYLPWHKVEYQSNKQKKTGYIWLGLLCLDKVVDSKSGNTFMYGFAWKSNEESEDYYWVEAKVLDKNKTIINSKSFPYYPGGQSYTNGELSSGKDIPNTKNIYSIKFLGEACGISSEDNLFSWDGLNFTTLPKTVAVSDAGVFYYSEELILPNKHKLGKDIILKVSEEGEVEEYDDSDLDAELIYKVKKKEETFQWDGSIYKKVSERTLN